MSTALHQPWTVERFLAWEDRQEGRHEFDGNRVIAMTGGTRDHQRIVYNLLRLLEARLDSEKFDAVAEMRLDVVGGVRYPDVVVCQGQIPGQVRTLRDAVVTFEVLSDDTAHTDRETKPAEYGRVPGMRRYVLIEQSRRAVTVFERSGDRWIETPIVADAVPLPELGIDAPLAEIYLGVRFA